VDCRRHGPYGAPRARPGNGVDGASHDLGLNSLARHIYNCRKTKNNLILIYD
jgi:hypothetical protein